MNSLSSPTNFIAQGQGLFENAESMAENLSNGSFSGTMTALGGLINDLPAGDVKTALADLATVGLGAASGAAMGSAIWPGIGTAVGAAVGAIVGVFEDIFSSEPPMPQGEYRWSAEASSFPAVSDSSLFGCTVLPGAVNYNPRGVVDAIFYQLSDEADPNLIPDSDWHLDYSFRIGWISGKGSTTQTRLAGWYLAYLQSARESKTLSLCSAQVRTQKEANIKIAQNQLESLVGKAGAARAMRLLDDWYGHGFDMRVPFSRLMSRYNLPSSYLPIPPMVAANGRVIQAFQNALSAWGCQGSTDGVPPMNAVLVKKVFDEYPMDYSYFPVYTYWNGSEHARSNPRNATACYLTPDTLRLGLAELACEGAADVVALHYVMGLAHNWKLHQKNDLLKNLGSTGDPSCDPSFKSAVKPHPNFMRVLGRIATKMKAAKTNLAPATASYENPSVFGLQTATGRGILSQSQEPTMRTREHMEWVNRCLSNIRRAKGKKISEGVFGDDETPTAQNVNYTQGPGEQSTWNMGPEAQTSTEVARQNGQALEKLGEATPPPASDPPSVQDAKTVVNGLKGAPTQTKEEVLHNLPENVIKPLEADVNGGGGALAAVAIGIVVGAMAIMGVNNSKTGDRR